MTSDTVIVAAQEAFHADARLPQPGVVRWIEAKRVGLRLSSATVITAITLTVVPACASTNEKGSSPSSRDVISSATDCAALAEELLLENAAQGFVETRSPGGERSCAIEVRAGSAALRQLGLNAEGCPPEASIILPFARSAEGWSLDRQGLSELDNGDCFS